MNQKRASFDIQLNSISNTDNPTKKEVEFILFDFEVSRNNTVISKEVAEKALDSLENMPIVARYHENSTPGADDDALGGHEATLSVTRDGKNHYVELKTTPIGVFTEPAYITTVVDENGEEKEVVAGRGILWASRFPNVIGLLQEWIDQGIVVSSSMEILYDEYRVEDGVEEILNFVFEGHCLLNSENRGEHKKIEPAYDVSKLTRLVAQAVQNNKKEEHGLTKTYKKVFELSHNDIRTKLYKLLDERLEDDQYSWILDVYDTYFIVEIDTVTEDDYKSEIFKFNYAKTEDDEVSIDFDSKVAVMEKTEWVELDEVKSLQAEIEEKEERIKKMNSEKEDLRNKLNEASEKLVHLNSKIEELQEYKSKYEKEQFEKQLSETKELYREKFAALNALDKFESEDVQELIHKAVTNKDAEMQLNTMIVDMIELKEVPKKEEKTIIQLNSKRENLAQSIRDFDSRYK